MRRKKRPVQFDLFGHPIEEAQPQVGGLMPLDFEGERIRAVTIKGEPWFVAADACRLLDLEAGARHVRGRLDADDIRTVAEACGTTDVINGLRFDALLVNEPGLYQLIFESRKPAARRFKKWVTSEVLPAIRKTGSYSIADSRFLRVKKRLQCDDETAKQRCENILVNKQSHSYLSEEDSTPRDYADWHNAAYRGAYGVEAKQLRRSLQIKDYQTPLDRMSQVCLMQNSHAKGLAMKIIRESGREYTPEERNTLLESIAREMAQSDLRQLGPSYQYGIEVDRERGRILDAIQPQIEVA